MMIKYATDGSYVHDPATERDHDTLSQESGAQGEDGHQKSRMGGKAGSTSGNGGRRTSGLAGSDNGALGLGDESRGERLAGGRTSESGRVDLREGPG